MNILIYTYSWYPKIDGVTVRYKNIIDKLKWDNNIFLVTADDINNRTQIYPRIETESIPGRQLPKICRDDNPDVIIPDMRKSSEIYYFLLDYCKSNKINLIHVTSPDPCINIFQLISLKLNIPIISIYHTDVLSYLKVSNKKWYEIYLAWAMHFTHAYNLLDCFSTTSPVMAKKIREYSFYPKKKPIWIVPISIDTELFKPATCKYDSFWEKDTTKLLYVGRVTTEKSIERIINSMDDSMSLIIIGEGGATDSLSKLANESGERKKVKFIDTIDQSELPYWYSSADIFVMPSSTETLGFVTLEAMSCGLPVCGFADGGTLDIIENNVNGILFKTNEELKQSINKIITDDEFKLNIVQNGLKYIEDKTLNNSIDLLYDKYLELISTERKTSIFNFLWVLLLNLFIFINKIIYNILD